MCRKLIFLTSFVLLLGSTAHAALYLWNGSAADGLWETPANWTVTDSAWTWPNEEYGNRQVNSDTIAIDILNGDAVSRGSDLGIDGAADGSTTGVLTLNNASSLTVAGSLATSTDPGRRGQIDILGGSTVTIVGDGKDLAIADDPGSWGMLNIVDSILDIADDLKIGDDGEGHVVIGGSTTVNCDDMNIVDKATGVGYLDISGNATVTIVDDFTIDEGTATVTISGDAVISFGDDCYLPDKTGAQGTMTLTGNSVFNVGDDMTIADDDGTVGHVIVTGNATLNAPDELYLADAPTAFATLDVNGTATVNVGDDLDVGEDGPAICNIGENATVIVADTIYIPHHEQGIEARMTISGNASVTCDDIQVVNDGGNTGYLHISGNPTINARLFYMNNDAGTPATSEVIMDGGTVTVTESSTINDDNNGLATFIMNGGSFYSGGYLNVSDNLDGTAHLTMNGGEMITGDRLRLGKDGGEDIGQVRIFMNGGLLQAEKLDDIKITDTKIIYTGGLLRIGSADVNEADMQQLITDGTIVADGVYSIATAGGYTVLNPLSPSMPKLPDPADGAEGVLLGTTLSWGAGNTAATHDVYFGTSSPPPLIGNQEAATYYPGPIELGTTYYWQIVEVEADGTTKHIGDVWSFTTTTDLSTVSEIATQPNPADGAIDVAPDATLSWWPGASAASHDVYFGTTSPPALIGSTTGFSFDPGPLEFGTTYYWRVDAVEADGTTKHTGDIWSFTPLYDVTAPGDTVKGVPDDRDWPDDEAPPFAIDDDIETKYLHYKGPTQPTGFQVTASASQSTVTALTFTTANDAPERDPVAFELSGSNVSIDGPYTLIASGDIVDFSQTSAWPRFTMNETPISFENEVVYDHYQVLFTAIRDAASANSMQIAEVQLLGFYLNAWAPDPADSATDVLRTATLSWLPGATAASHDVYFGDSDPPAFIGNQAETGYDPGFLKVGTTYYWRVDEVEADGTKRTGDVWSFTTELGKATQPDPADGATEVEKTPTLSWLPGVTAASHDVYFGDSDPPAFVGNQADTSYSPTGLAKSTTYYWRIDEVEADGTTKYTGDVWSFTTTTAGR